MNRRGLFVGRFQPLHIGHVDAIERALKDSDELIVGIGSSQFGYTKENPFTYEERREMLEKSVKGNISIHPVPDTYDYPAWVGHVESIVPKFDVVYSGSMITQGLFRQKGYEVNELVDHQKASATMVRERIARGEPWEDLVPRGVAEVIKRKHGEERIKHLFNNYKYPKSTLTVDAVVKHEDKFVFVKRKKAPFKGLVALPGGHVEPGEKIESAVVREVEEETGLEFQMAGFLGVYNKLGRDPRGSYATVVFYGKGVGSPKAGDDAESLVITEKIPDEMAFDHLDIVRDYGRRVA